jgi:hypothetical protein
MVKVIRLLMIFEANVKVTRPPPSTYIYALVARGSTVTVTVTVRSRYIARPKSEP